MHRILPLVLIVAACDAGDRRDAPAASTTPPALANATQLDLARELDDAEARGTWATVKRRWTGQALRWTVTRQRALCRTADACHVAAFPVQRPARYGWMPALAFAPGQWDAVQAQCGTRETCELTIEGTLDKLEVSAEEPTNLRLANVRVLTRTVL
jgi:hypothetical protein